MNNPAKVYARCSGPADQRPLWGKWGSGGRVGARRPSLFAAAFPSASLIHSRRCLRLRYVDERAMALVIMRTVIAKEGRAHVCSSLATPARGVLREGVGNRSDTTTVSLEQGGQLNQRQCQR